MKQILKINRASDFKQKLDFHSEDQMNSKKYVAERWLYTRKEVAEIFGVSLVCLWAWDRKYVLKSIKVGGRRYYTRAAIIEALNNNSLKSDNYENK